MASDKGSCGFQCASHLRVSRQHVGSGGGDAALATDEASEWLALILRVASLILPAELPELLWLVESSLRHSPALRAALFCELRRSTAQLIMGGGTDGSSTQSVTHGTGGASVSGRGVSQLDATSDGSNERVDAIYAEHMARLAVLMLLLQRTAQPLLLWTRCRRIWVQLLLPSPPQPCQAAVSRKLLSHAMAGLRCSGCCVGSCACLRSARVRRRCWI